MRRYGRVVLGGTFDRLHAGHEALLRTAFQLGRSVAIGLTSQRFLAAHPKPRGGTIGSEATRRRELERWLRRHYAPTRWTVVPLDDPFGGAVGEGVDALVVSADTVAGGRAVNRERVRRGRPAVPLVVVPLVLADDLEPLSSRRIRAGEVDREGHHRGPISVWLTVAAESDRAAAARGVRRAFPRARTEQLRGRGPRGPARRARARQGAPGGPPDLSVTVGRRDRAGWQVQLRGRRAKLDPRRVAGRSPRELEDGLARLLRPAPPKRL